MCRVQPGQHRLKDFGPRLGFSWMLDKKTVVQAGSYVAFLQGGAYEFGTANVIPNMGSLLAGTFSRSSTGSNTPGYGNWDTNQMPIPPQNPFILARQRNSIGYFNQNLGEIPMMSRGMFPSSGSLPWNMFLSAAYVGNRASICLRA